nr:MAG TPA: hypothetical protein [Caudoviricetes sp.]
MTIKEFTERTGFYPTYEHYKFIEKSYMNFNGDKDVFCKAYKANENGLAEKITREVERFVEEQTELGMHEHDAMEERIARQAGIINNLQAQLDAELEWTPCKDAGTRMTQRDYVKLREDRFTKTMTDEEAADFIAEKLGFNAARVKIIRKAETYEVNKHHRMRVAETYDREPLYESTDWNYVRFDVYSMAYEYINGQLTLYSR